MASRVSDFRRKLRINSENTPSLWVKISCQKWFVERRNLLRYFGKRCQISRKWKLKNKRNYKITDPHCRLFALFAQSWRFFAQIQGHNSPWTAKLVRQSMYSYAISLTSFNKEGKGFRTSDPIKTKKGSESRIHSARKEKGSELPTPFNRAEKGFRTSDPFQQGRKRVQNFWPHLTRQEKGSEHLIPFNKEGKGFRISDPIQQGRKRIQNFWVCSTKKERGSEFLTPFNREGKGFRISDPW